MNSKKVLISNAIPTKRKNIRFVASYLFLCSLPWVWLEVQIGGVVLRPSFVVAFIITIASCILIIRRPDIIDIKYFGLIVGFATLAFAFSQIHANPHWEFSRVAGFVLYLLCGYCVARYYVKSFVEVSVWKYTYVGIILIVVSSATSFYLVFGTLVFSAGETSSSHFIHGVLMRGLLIPGESGGLRHAMGVACVVLAVHVFQVRDQIKSLAYISIVALLYLSLLTLSRSSMLSALVILLGALLVLFRASKYSSHGRLRFYAYLSTCAAILLIASSFLGLFGVIEDRIFDSASGNIRGDEYGKTFSEMLTPSFFVGLDSSSQPNPHNFILDSILHGGMLLAILAFTLLFWVCRSAVICFLNRNSLVSSLSLFCVPGVVRSLTVGGGLPHLAEIFGMAVVLRTTIFLYSKSRAQKPKKIVDRRFKK